MHVSGRTVDDAGMFEDERHRCWLTALSRYLHNREHTVKLGPIQEGHGAIRMPNRLDFDEKSMLKHLCDDPWIRNRRYDPTVSLRLERKGLAQMSMLGQLCPTPAGRLMASLYRM